MWRKTARLQHIWASDHCWLNWIETQPQSLSTICWLSCRHEQKIDYVTAQTLNPFLQCLVCHNAWSIKNLGTMNTQKLSNLKVFQLFSTKRKIHLPHWCPRKSLWFVCECILNLLNGNLHSRKRHRVAKFQRRFEYCLWNENFGSIEETFWRPENAYSSQKSLLFPSLTICVDMEQFFVVPASV